MPAATWAQDDRNGESGGQPGVSFSGISFQNLLSDESGRQAGARTVLAGATVRAIAMPELLRVLVGQNIDLAAAGADKARAGAPPGPTRRGRPI